MGCCVARPSVYVLYPKLAPWQTEFEALALRDHEIYKMYKVYQKVDVDGSGSIELIELLTHIDIDRTPFAERIFSIFDEDGSGEIDFREFVLSLWNYCTLGKSILDLFSFDLYDRDSSGALSVQEIEGMCKDIYGKTYKSNMQAKGIMRELGNLGRDDDLDLEFFCKFCRTHQALLFPCFRLQEVLRKSCLGTSFWERHSQRRVELCKGKYMSIAEFMKIHVNKDAYNEVVDLVNSDPLNRRGTILLEATGIHADRKKSVLKKNDITNQVERLAVNIQ